MDHQLTADTRYQRIVGANLKVKRRAKSLMTRQLRNDSSRVNYWNSELSVAFGLGMNAHLRPALQLLAPAKPLIELILCPIVECDCFLSKWIAVLVGLSGVGIPVASAILTAMFPLCYTVIDKRALTSLDHPKDRSSLSFCTQALTFPQSWQRIYVIDMLVSVHLYR
jgi:hypothetical protein